MHILHFLAAFSTPPENRDKRRTTGIGNAVGLILVLLGALSCVCAQTWKTVAQMPAPVAWGMAGAPGDGLVYVAGGQNSSVHQLSTFYAYNPATNTWSSKPSMPTARTQGASAVLGGELYVIGGWGPYVPYSTVEAYNPSASSWSSVASLPHLSGCGFAGAIGGKIYVFSPCNGYSGYYALLDVYDPSSNQWTSLPSGPNSHASGVGGILEGKFYVAGGIGSNSAATTETDVYDPATNAWKTVSPMPAALGNLGGGVVNGKLYAVGGTLNGVPVATTYVYDPDADQWMAGPPLASPATAMASATMNGTLYMCGGSSATQIVSTVSTLSPAVPTGQWVQLSPTGGGPAPRTSYLPAVAGDPGQGNLILFGGNSGSSETNDTWRLANANGIATPNWVKLIAGGSAGSPPARGNALGAWDPVTSSLIVFGGCQGTCLPVSNDVWVLRGSNGMTKNLGWTQIYPTGGPPQARQGMVGGYDPTNNILIVFAGQNGLGTSAGNTFSDVWLLKHANGTGGTPTWTQLNPTGTTPTGQVYAGAGYNPYTNRLVVTGGIAGTGNGPATNAVWVLANANGLGGAPIWSNPIPEGKAGSPPDGTVRAAVYDAGSNALMTLWNAGANNTTWLLSNADGSTGTPFWTQLPTAPGVTGGAVFDRASNRLTSFFQDSSANSVWALTNANQFPAEPTAAKPSIQPASGSYPGSFVVSISDKTANAAIHYTTDGSTPTAGSTLYTGGFLVAAAATINAVAVAPDYLISPVATANYKILPPMAATPVFTPASGSFGQGIWVSVTDSTPGAALYYADESSFYVYTGPFLIQQSTTLAAVAVAYGYTPSAIAVANYTVEPSPSLLPIPASGLGGGNATLNAALNNLGNPSVSWFVYGTSSAALTMSTAQMTQAGSQKPQNIATQINGLNPQTTYYFEPVSKTVGGKTYGKVLSFTAQ